MQWLATAAAGTRLCVTALLRENDKAFYARSYLDTKHINKEQFQAYMRRTANGLRGPELKHGSEDTPQTRLQTLDEATPFPEADCALKKRRRLTRKTTPLPRMSDWPTACPEASQRMR